MKFNIFIKKLFSRCLGIIRSPKIEWVKINEEDDSIFNLIISFLLPLLILLVVASMIGSYIPMIGKGFAADILLSTGLMQFGSILLSIAVSIFAVNGMIGTFKGTPSIRKASKLVIYSYVPGILVAIILGIAPWFYILGLLFLYSFYIFFQGTPVMLDIPVERQSNFSTLSSTTMLIVYLMINLILARVFDAT
jgi:hypothetical protein